MTTRRPDSGDDQLFNTLAPVLTHQRLAPYLSAADGNQRNAIRLYRWNIDLSGAVYEALHVFEVVLRNAIDTRLAIWNAEQTDRGRTLSAEWLLEPAPLLRRLVRTSELDRAHDRAERAVRHHRRAPGHDDLLAQLSFGTWRFLLPDRDPGRRYLWDATLSNAFPHLSRQPHKLVESVDGIYRLRNRVAHLEPLLRSSIVREQYLNMRTVLGEIDPGAEQWFTSNQRVTRVLRARP